MTSEVREATRVSAEQTPAVIAGWREWASLPDLGIPWVKVKLDTGARSSAIHAHDIELIDRDGERWARFEIHPWQRSDNDALRVELPVIDERAVRSSSGHSEDRWVVATTISLMGLELPAELTLANRDQLGFRMLIGREALRGRFLVDPGRSYLGGRPSRATRRQNRATVES